MSSSLYRALGGAPRGRALAALRHRNFRAYLPGQAISMVGMSVFAVTMSWLVYARTASILWVGVAVALQYLPSVGGRPLARVLLRTASQRVVLLGTQTLFCCIAAALLLVAVIQRGEVTVWALLLLALLWGGIKAADAPVRQIFLVDLVGRRDLTYAMSLVASIWNAASLAGAAAAGVLLVAGGAWLCFALLFLTVVAGVVSLLLVAETPSVVAGDGLWHATHTWRSLRGGAWSRRVVALVVLGCAFSALGMNRLTLLPALFAGRLDAGPLEFGLGMAAAGLGAGAGAAFLLWNGRGALRAPLLWPALIWAITLGLTGWSTIWPLTLVLLALGGAAQTWLLGIVGQQLQGTVSDRDRGPAISFYARCAIATNVVGPLQAALLGAALGTSVTLAIDAVLLAAVALVVGVGLRHAEQSTDAARPSSAAR